MVEQTHRRLKEDLAARGGIWTHNLPWVLLGLRNTPWEDNNLSPAQMMYGTSCTLLGSIIDSPEYTGQDLLDAFRQLKSAHQHQQNQALPRIPASNSCFSPSAGSTAQAKNRGRTVTDVKRHSTYSSSVEFFNLSSKTSTQYYTTATPIQT